MSAKQVTSLSFPEPDIGVLTLDDPHKSANVLSSEVLAEIEQALDELDGRSGLAGLVIRSAKPGMFIAGADLREFLQWIDAPADEVASHCRRGQQIFGRLARGSYVTVAAIDGPCLGGGAEMAIWCDRRVMTTGEQTSFGFPEVKLGLFPGWGGTARTPRMIGLGNAAELVTGGEPVDTAQAQQLGLASDVVRITRASEGDPLLAAAIRMIRSERGSGDYLRDRAAWAGPVAISETELGFLGATASAYIRQQTGGNYPAPLAALEVMLEAAGVDLQTACQTEANAFPELFGSEVNRALLNVFFLRDRNKKDPGVAAEVQPGEVTSVSVIGAGIMGQGIAAAIVKRRVPVTITDASPQALAAGVQGVLTEVAFNKHTRQSDVGRAIEFSPLVNGSVALAQIAAADLIIEAIVENIDAKKALFAELEPQLRDTAILASNTSTIQITKLAADLARPEQLCGLHFFNPVRRMPLVEVIRGEQTSDQTIATAVAFAKRLGKSPIVVNDGPGFLVNRLLLPYMNESLELLLEGATLRQVERAAKSFGMPMGPITLFDVVGLDTSLHAGRVMYGAFPDRIVPSELLTAMYKAGRLGQKTGKGFFSYHGKRGRGVPDPDVEAMLAERIREKKDFHEDELIERMFLPMVCEATRVLAEGVVRDAHDVDLGLILGIGFPPFKGGLLCWADTLGAKTLVEKLKPYEALGPRYVPTEMLQAMASGAREGFYAADERTRPS